MNESLMIFGAVAAVSIFVVGLMVVSIGSLLDNDFSLIGAISNNTLDEDLKDILDFIPLDNVRLIIDNYVMYDEQIHETVKFIDEQKKFILDEFRRMPQSAHLVNVLRSKGLDVDEWNDKIQNFWKTLPPFVKTETTLSLGGFTVMISDIMKSVPQGELHEMLKQKAKCSSSFRWFLQMLRSEFFHDLCSAIDGNAALQRHVYWAKEAGIEVTFAIEFLNHLYIYLLEELI